MQPTTLIGAREQRRFGFAGGFCLPLMRTLRARANGAAAACSRRPDGLPR